MTEKLILRIEKNHINRYGWEDDSTDNCILNIGDDLGFQKVTTHGQVIRRLERLCRNGFIKKRDIEKYRKAIGQFDNSMGTKIHLNRIVKLAKCLDIQVNIYELDESGKRHVNPEIIIK